MVTLEGAVSADRAAGQAAAAADPAVAMVTAPATAMMVSLFRFQVMIRSRDKMTLRLVAALMNHAARDFLHPDVPPPHSRAGGFGSWMWRGSGRQGRVRRPSHERGAD
jgi:hypothetical protein